MIRPPTSPAGGDADAYRPDGPIIHHLKTWPEFYRAIERKEKTFDIRLNDRGFKVGDFLMLNEYDGATKYYTGHTQYMEVTYMLKGIQWGIVNGYAILGIKPCTYEWAYQALAAKGDQK
jgi:hypothetical protein